MKIAQRLRRTTLWLTESMLVMTAVLSGGWLRHAHTPASHHFCDPIEWQARRLLWQVWPFTQKRKSTVTLKAATLFRRIRNGSDSLLQHKVFCQPCQMNSFVECALSCLDCSQEPSINIHVGFIFTSEEEVTKPANAHLQVSLIPKGVSTALYCLTKFPKYLDFAEFTLLCSRRKENLAYCWGLSNTCETDHNTANLAKKESHCMCASLFYLLWQICDHTD